MVFVAIMIIMYMYLIVINQYTILDECRTLWGEPERVQLSNVHGAVACACVPRPTWNRCMCMTVSACHPNVIAQLKDTSHQKL